MEEEAAVGADDDTDYRQMLACGCMGMLSLAMFLFILLAGGAILLRFADCVRLTRC